MLASPRITVVVPVYNTGSYLPRAMDALLAQTFQDFELIIVDDGSTDGSAAICDQQAARDPRCSVLHKPNGGLSSARNCGIEHARGEFIIFPDSDDWVEPTYLETLLELHRQYRSDLEICGHFVTSSTSEEVHNPEAPETSLSPALALEVLMQTTAFKGFAWNKLFHMDLIQRENLRFDEELGMAQDLHFAFRYIRACTKIVYSPQPQYHYFQEGGGVTSINTPLSPRKLSGLTTYLKIAEMAHGQYPAVEQAAYGTFFNMSLHFIYIYFASKMKDQAVLAQLQDNLRNYQRFFFASRRHSMPHKFLGWLAMRTPRGYYWLKRAHLGRQ